MSKDHSFETVVEKLIKTPLFSDFDKNNDDDKRILRILFENMSVKHFKKGEIIIKEGETGKFCYILYSGIVQVFRSTPAGDKIALANLHSDQNVFFGENALISNEPRSASVQAIEDCTTIVLSGKKFLKLCKEEPVLGFRVILYIARNMAKTIISTNNDKATLYEALFDEVEGNYD